MTNPMFDNKSHFGFADSIRLMIADDPTVISRTRESLPDKFRGNKVITTVGPYTVRIEPFRAIRGTLEYSEKGSLAMSDYAMLAVDIPPGTFDENDTVIAGTTKYRVANVDEDGVVTQANLQLVQ